MSFKYILSVDLGQIQNYTALALIEEKLLIVERNEINTLNYKLAQKQKIKAASIYHCRDLERLPLGTTYPGVVEHIKAKMNHPELVNETILLMDQTGVGRPVIDLARERGLAPIAITIHGGRERVISEDGYHVPKREIIVELVKLFQSSRLQIARSLPYAKELEEELINFRMKISKTGRDTYEAWREEDKDDLVLALAMAAWFASITGGAEHRMLSLSPKKNLDWDPLAWDDEDEEPTFNPAVFPGRMY